MPYPTLQSLPAFVRKLSKAKQKRWQKIWNSVFDQTGSEEKAFKAANAIIKESVNGKEADTMKKNGKYRGIEADFDLSEAMALVESDQEKGVIKNVVLLTGEVPTKNKTLYTKGALKEAASRYEGAKMFLDHGEDMVRSVRDLGGVYRNVRLNENKVLGDLHLRDSDEVREIAFTMAREKIGGLSIRDRGRGREENDVFIVEGFAKSGPYSIDLVTEPSANMNLFEHQQDDEDDNKGGSEDMDIKEITLEILSEKRKDLIESIQADARKTFLEEFKEMLKKGESADKILLLAESGFPSEVSKKVREMIEPESVTLEVAKKIVENFKEISEKIVPSNENPKVKGHGAAKDDDQGKPKEINEAEVIESLYK